VVFPADGVVSGCLEERIPIAGDVVRVWGMDWKWDLTIEDGFMHQIDPLLTADSIVESGLDGLA